MGKIGRPVREEPLEVPAPEKDPRKEEVPQGEPVPA